MSEREREGERERELNRERKIGGGDRYIVCVFLCVKHMMLA